MQKQVLAVAMLVLLVALFEPAFGADVARTEGWTEPIWTLGPDAITWTTVTPSPTPTGRSAIGWIGEYVYVFGNESFPTVALYWHVPTETWGNSTPHPSGSSDNWAGAVLGGELYVLGRFNLSVPTNEFWKFTPDGSGTGTWTRLANYPMNVTMLAVSANEDWGIIQAAGGYDGVGGITSHYAYDVVGGNWVAYAPLPQARLCVGGTHLDHKFYVLGGLESASFTYTNTLYMYDPDSAAWFQKANLPQPVAFNWSSVINDGNYIYQVGGGGGYGSWPARNTVQVYDAAGDSWFLETSLPSANGTNSAAFVAYYPDTNYILSTGGWYGGQYIGQTFKGTGPPVGLEETSNFQFPISSFQSLKSFPNPFNQATTIRYDIASAVSGRPTAVSLAIYDLSGRLVRTLIDQTSSHPTMQISNRAIWDGTDYLGRPVTSGVYLLSLRAGDLRSARAITVMR